MRRSIKQEHSYSIRQANGRIFQVRPSHRGLKSIMAIVAYSCCGSTVPAAEISTTTAQFQWLVSPSA